jgi:preprotein translocase subunit SecA
MAEKLNAQARQHYEEREQLIGSERALFHQRMIMLQIVDSQWKDHLYSLDHLKEGIGLRGYGQRDPLVEYKKESYQMFQGLMDRIDEEILRWTFLYQPVVTPEPGAGREADAAALRGRPLATPAREPELAMAGASSARSARPRPNLSFNDPSATPTAFARAAQPREAEGGAGAAVQTVRREGKKVGRNEPCPCGNTRSVTGRAENVHTAPVTER